MCIEVYFLEIGLFLALNQSAQHHPTREQLHPTQLNNDYN